MPNLSYSGSNLAGTNFSAPFNNAFFTSVSFKGALQTTDWTTTWAQWCPQSASYCSFAGLKAAATIGSIGFAPNPSYDMVTATFEAEAPGTAVLSVMDKVTGIILISKEIKVAESGKQSISFSVAGLREGVYPVMVKTSHGILQGKLLVK